MSVQLVNFNKASSSVPEYGDNLLLGQEPLFFVYLRDILTRHLSLPFQRPRLQSIVLLQEQDVCEKISLSFQTTITTYKIQQHLVLF